MADVAFTCVFREHVLLCAETLQTAVHACCCCPVGQPSSFSHVALISGRCCHPPSHCTAPVYGAGGELIFSGQDLSIGGALEYFHDVLYICIFVQVR